MKRVLSLFLSIIMILSMLPAVTIATEPETTEKTYSYADIVRRTWDMSYLANEPKAGEGGKEITSTDPDSTYNENTGKYENWDGNYDMTGYVRMEDDWRVLADLEGPGYMTRFWIPTLWSGTMQLFIDGDLIYEGSTCDFIWGDLFSEFSELSFQANHHDTEQFGPGYLGGIDLFVPITYNESLKLRIDCDEKSTMYYNLCYYELEDGATVESFSLPLSTENRQALKEANDILKAETVPTGNTTFEQSVGAGETVTVFESNESGAITSTALSLDIADFDDKESLASWVVSMYWDGSETPAVSMPVADFYGSSYGNTSFDSAAYGVAEDGTLYSRWYMPYNAAKITLTNRSDTACTAKMALNVETLTAADANELLRFHANWQRSYARDDDRSPDAQMLFVEGAGRYVGTSLHVYQIVDGIWWGEGDEKFFVDGEKYPSWFGTGSEDYFCYAWCGSSLFDYPYCGQPHNDGYPATGEVQLQGHGDKINYRLHITDSVCFRESFEANIEKYHSEEADSYAATTFFYLTKGTSSNHKAEAPTVDERLFNNDLISGPALFYPGMYLTSRIISTNTSVTPWNQPLEPQNGFTWYGNMQMFWQTTGKGKEMEILLNIPETDIYDFTVSLTTACDYGCWQISLDEEVLDTVNCFSGTVSQKDIVFENLFLNEGEHVLKLRCTGKQGASNYYLGVNYLEFVAAEPETVDLTIGWDTLDDNIANYTVGSAPGLQGTGGFTTEKQKWYKDTHLIWTATEGQSVTFNVNIPSGGVYSMDIGFTNAADFGKFSVSVDGVDTGLVCDGYQPGAVYHNQRTAYCLELTAGKHTVTITGAGKHANAAGYLVAIDYLHFKTQTEVGAYYDGAIELMSRITAQSADAPYWQDLGWIAVETWQRNGQLMYNPANVGGEISFSVELPANGSYTVTTGFTKAGDFGITDVLVDGTSIGQFDGYGELGHSETTSSAISLTAGEHTLTYRCAGKTGTAYLIGLDYASFSATYTAPVIALEENKKVAADELNTYKETALNSCTELQKPELYRTNACGMAAIWKCDSEEQIVQVLAQYKQQIDTILATQYYEPIELDEPDDLYFEGADLVSKVSSNNGGEVVGQGIAVFSNGAHLFWRSDDKNELCISLDIPYTCDFTVEYGYSCAGDFGMYDVYIDDVKLTSVDAYSGTLGAKTTDCGSINLTKGTHTLKLVVTGKNSSSGGYYSGVDHLWLKAEITHSLYIQAAIDALSNYKREAEYKANQWELVLQAVKDYSDQLRNTKNMDELNKVYAEAKEALDLIPTGIFDYKNPSFISGKTPADYGWQADDSAFGDWQVGDDGEVLFVSYDGSASKRVWKKLITDPDNFAISTTVKIASKRAEIEVMGVHIELNCEHGNGNQIFDKVSWNWFAAKNQICKVVVARNNGGDLQIKFLGQDNETPVTFTKPVVNENDTNVYIGVIDVDGSAFFSETIDEGMVLQSPADFGWDTDEISGEKDFSGWSSADGTNINATYADMTGNCRIWKNLVEDQSNFDISLDIAEDNQSTIYIKVLGQSVEIDGRNGDGNQVGVKLNGQWQDWLSATSCKATVELKREKGGDIQVTVTGAGNSTPMTRTMTPSEESNNLELGLYAGQVKISNISVAVPSIDITGDITNASLTLSSNLALTYFAEVKNAPAEATVTMKFTRGEQTAEVTGKLDTDTGLYAFEYTGINPQCMTDSIDAVLYVNDTKVAENKGYTVKKYCETAYCLTANANLKTLLADLLTYGAEAQKVMNYRLQDMCNTANWVSEEKTEFDAQTVTGVKSATNTLDSGKKFASAYMKLTYVNEIFFNVACDNAEGVKVKISLSSDGVEYKEEKTIALSSLSNNDGIYEVNAGAVKASDITKIMKAELVSGSETLQTVLYSVDSYVNFAKDNATFGNLVKALHNYGISSREYLAGAIISDPDNIK